MRALRVEKEVRQQMSKGTHEKTGEEEFGHADAQEKGRGFGLFATLTVLTVLGIVIWFILNQEETS